MYEHLGPKPEHVVVDSCEVAWFVCVFANATSQTAKERTEKLCVETAL